MNIRVCAAVLATVFVVGCGGGDEEPTPPPAGADAGQELFSANCANCHALAAAGAAGRVGPDLDQVRPGPDLVVAQTTNGGGSMPAFGGRLSTEEIQQIADYVAANAGSGG